MHTVIHRADARGYFDHGWLKTYHTFSFGHYQNPERMQFGKLRVLNDDVVAPGGGFGAHSHENMEIVSIPLSGALSHKDSAGHEETIAEGDVQVMSAGTGIWHSEFNHSETETVNFLQIWILPAVRGVAPRYDQKHFDRKQRRNSLQTVIAPGAQEEALWLTQQAYCSLADIDSGVRLDYRLRESGNGVYLFVIEGEIAIGEERLGKRDGMGIHASDEVTIRATQLSELLLIEVPMS